MSLRIENGSCKANATFKEYRLRLPQSATFAEYAIGHIKRLVGDKMLVDMNETSVIKYQNDRLTERAAPKTVNEEVGFLLRIMGDLGDLLRARLRKKKKKLKLRVRNDIGKAYTGEEKDRMLAEAANARSPHIYLALTLALNAAVRDAELRGLTWAQIKFARGYLVVGQSKTEAGEGRTIPLNSSLCPVLRNTLSGTERSSARLGRSGMSFRLEGPAQAIRRDPSLPSRWPGRMSARTPR
jgi:integrase